MDVPVKQARYQIRVYDPLTGTASALIMNWIALSYVKQVNNFHTLQLVLGAYDPVIPFFQLDAIVEVWRRTDGSTWYRELVTLFRTLQYDLYENGHETYTVYCRGLNDLLHRRHVLYPATTAPTLKSGPADDVMKEFVRENCTSLANVAARKSFGVYDAAIYGLTVNDDASVAPVWTGARAWLNLLDVLLDVSLSPSDTDFEIVRAGTIGLNLEFTTYYPQRGVDRSSTVTFSPHLGNMRDIKVTYSRTEEANIVFVLGNGEGTGRQVLAREASLIVQNESRWNAIETTTDARTQDSVAAFTTQGDELLEKLKAQLHFEFNVLQTSGSQYGREYDVGDRIRARYRDYDVTRKIVSANVSMTRGKESISLDFDSPGGSEE